MLVDDGVGQGEADRDGGISQGVASTWADMMSSIEASPPELYLVIATD